MSFFEVNRRYRHEKCLDVDIVVFRVKETCKAYDLFVRYFNRNLNLFHEQFDDIKIKKTDLDMWTEVDEGFYRGGD